MSFGVPTALATCATNAENALIMRHLTKPKYQARERFPNVFLLQLKQPLRLAYEEALRDEIGDDAAWRVGKKQVKLAMIDKSRMFDKLQAGKARSFVKFEVGTRVPKKARLIQGNVNECTAYYRPAEYQALGTALKKLGHTTFRDGTTDFQFHYAGGLNHNELSDLASEWLQMPNIYIDERDGANWDSTMQRPTLTAELLVYEMLKCKSAMEFAIRSALVQGKIYTRSHENKFRRWVVKYETAWKRLSGDWNTSVGNTMISMMIAFVAITELPTHLKPKTVRALFMGDDYWAVYQFDELPDPRCLADAMNAKERTMGITPERGIFVDPFATTFISLGLWPRQGGGYQFVPQIGKQLRKLYWTTKRCTLKQAEEIANGISIAFWPVYRGHPLMMRFLKAHYTGKKYVEWDHYFGDKLTKQDRNIDWVAGSIYRYNIPLVAYSFDLDGIAIYHHPVVEETLRIESLDPQDRPACLSRP